ncbi:hypothetical protein Gogos_021948, partial [Gossypium gossypioides]|nr:hypothetical protein [Gossypium gossypioides]
ANNLDLPLFAVRSINDGEDGRGAIRLDPVSSGLSNCAMYFLNKREYLYYKSRDVIASRVTIHENVNSAFAAEAHACLGAKEFKSIKFQHVHRTANTLADIIATESLKQRGGFYLEGAAPRYAVKTLEDEWVREPDL